ncbi:hypothetical protein AGABI2DRAFT_141764 [Agaricus bisporus var. bisporus H97]|uniref:hypothetical protein n=1 Tax=Agaricus bisporus var. bisporus (strain H97 / ATCC MYA-4626 / FGSC 10389) TaxID=936046 RepID=UPI00029F7811|nr:hypothetical protein AGABI2DRAFT_141764 [Agaricus bisporus var. bisporus H97]EKV49070.1 hypothetical protein AGABI2DRAFT_141764 [Agaricus bisporus var. bisporus H97]
MPPPSGGSWSSTGLPPSRGRLSDARPASRAASRDPSLVRGSSSQQTLNVFVTRDQLQSRDVDSDEDFPPLSLSADPATPRSRISSRASTVAPESPTPRMMSIDPQDLSPSALVFSEAVGSDEANDRALIQSLYAASDFLKKRIGRYRTQPSEFLLEHVATPLFEVASAIALDPFGSLSLTSDTGDKVSTYEALISHLDPPVREVEKIVEKIIYREGRAPPCNSQHMDTGPDPGPGPADPPRRPDAPGSRPGAKVSQGIPPPHRPDPKGKGKALDCPPVHQQKVTQLMQTYEKVALCLPYKDQLKAHKSPK